MDDYCLDSIMQFFPSNFSYNLSTSSDKSSTGYSSPGKRQHQPNMGVAAIGVSSQGSSLSTTVRRGDLRRQSQIIADESISNVVGVAAPPKKQGKNLILINKRYFLIHLYLP